MPLGLGILGIAHGHLGMYCDKWKEMPDEVRLSAIWDHDEARAQAASNKYKMAIERDSAALLKRADVDAVVIGAETSRHAELVEQAAAAGKDVVLQKPLALTLAEADRIVDAVRRSGIRFTLAWQMRVDPQNLQMRQMLLEGTLGQVFMIRRRHGLSTHTWPKFDESWHVKPELNRGMWADDAAHAIDFLYWMLGEPESVTAEIGTLYNPKVPDDHGIAVYRWADGTFGEVASSFVCVAGENTTEIVGEKGVIIQNYGDLISCNVPRPADAIGLKWFLRKEGQPPPWTNSDIPSPASHGARLHGLVRPMLDYLQGRREPIATAEEGRAVLRMTLASYAAASQGRRINVKDFQG